MIVNVFFWQQKKNAINDIRKGNNIRKKARFLFKEFKMLIGLLSTSVSKKLFDKTVRSGIWPKKLKKIIIIEPII